ncbi:hypothetical protein EMIHUDRAFT_233390 [Emiliania huxleyi CCMP1516]|uniref:K Homology domain-containing protein n=2 Tax=Emiliania huxleyi TaxID=2903 RepID=A0A0D3K251_EMIH1|nr:hypothetical protein EMIHUDRAFT_233390 [Emiliania huxleyi CCMP1516]EOD29836.1 hypothetical protein EMIHUDRAFT_233390 [Emiliania huxleyi CCMP1516]|eukprot:XP_005782265.1 hypothetical protein EMIHUDRAFT_233390 [Emiliania huxleyi CCMP1516]
MFGHVEPQGVVQPMYVSVVVTCPGSRIGKVIGPGGSGLRHLWRLARVRAHVPREALENGDREIQLTGTPEQVQQAQHIMVQMMSQPSLAPVTAPGGMMGMGGRPLAPHPVSAAPVGSARLLLESIRVGHLESGAHFELARGEWFGSGPEPSSLRSPDGTSCPVHLRDSTRSSQSQVLLPSEAVGSVVGKSGAGLKQPMQLSPMPMPQVAPMPQPHALPGGGADGTPLAAALGGLHLGLPPPQSAATAAADDGIWFSCGGGDELAASAPSESKEV